MNLSRKTSSSALAAFAIAALVGLTVGCSDGDSQPTEAALQSSEAHAERAHRRGPGPDARPHRGERGLHAKGGPRHERGPHHVRRGQGPRGPHHARPDQTSGGASTTPAPATETPVTTD